MAPSSSHAPFPHPLTLPCPPMLVHSCREIVAELTEYVTGVDAELGRTAVRSIGEIAVRVPTPTVVDGVVEALLECVEAEAEYVRAETVVVLQELLRVHPDRAASVIPSLHRVLKRMEDPTGKAAVIWMIGEYGQLIDDAPYLLEPLIDGVREEGSVAVRCELLTATTKLFFKRPPEVQKMLGRLFKACLDDDAGAATPAANTAASGAAAVGGAEASALVRDRALLYYRLLRANVKEAGSVISTGESRPPIVSFYDEAAGEEKDKIWSEFNTLSVLYGKPSEKFISEDHLIQPLPADAQQAGAAGASKGGAAADDDRLLSGDDDGLEGGVPGGAAAAAAAPAATGQPDFMDDLLGLGAPAPAPAPAPAAAAAPQLVPSPVLDPASFQGKWGSLAPVGAISMRAARLPSTTEVEAMARAQNISTIASGDVQTALKFFMYGQDAVTGSYTLFELVLDKGTGAITGTVKADQPARAQGAVAAMQAALRGIPAQ